MSDDPLELATRALGEEACQRFILDLEKKNLGQLIEVLQIAQTLGDYGPLGARLKAQIEQRLVALQLGGKEPDAAPPPPTVTVGPSAPPPNGQPALPTPSGLTPKRRGRPPGSKNAPKLPLAPPPEAPQ